MQLDLLRRAALSLQRLTPLPAQAMRLERQCRQPGDSSCGFCQRCSGCQCGNR